MRWPLARTSAPCSFRKSRQRRGRRHWSRTRSVVVGPAVDLRVLGEVGQDAAVLDPRLDLGVEGPLVQGLADRLLEPVEPLALGGADGDRVAWWAFRTSRNERSGTRSALFSTRIVGLVGQPELLEDGLDRLDLLLGLGARGVDDVEQQVGLAGLFERGLERGDQVVRQVADEADRVGEQHVPAAPELPAPGAGVERGEELVLDVARPRRSGRSSACSCRRWCSRRARRSARRRGRRPRAPCGPGPWPASPSGRGCGGRRAGGPLRAASRRGRGRRCPPCSATGGSTSA